MTFSLPFLLITDEAIEEVRSTVGRFKPESGGALLGPRSSRSLSSFIFDEDASVSDVTYKVSANLELAVNAAERQSPATQLKGILHSHPGGLSTPSSTDCQSFADYIEANDQLEDLVAVICTFRNGSSHISEHELLMGDLCFSFYVAHPSAHSSLVQPIVPRVCPVGRLKQVIQTGDSRVTTGPTFVASLQNSAALSFEVLQNSTVKGIVSVLEAFPTAPPFVYLANDLAQAKLVPLAWDPFDILEDRFASVAQAMFEPPRSPSDATIAPDNPDIFAQQPTVDRTVDGQSRARRNPAGSLGKKLGRLLPRPLTAKHAGRSDLLARSGSFLSQDIASESALILGCGSVGSTSAALLARCGIETFTLIDPDQVSAANIGRSTFTEKQIGQPKVSALGDNLVAINGKVAVETVHGSLESLDARKLEELVRGSSLVLGFCDTPSAQARLAHFSYVIGRPAVFVGIYEQASGGEIIASVAPAACYRCAVKSRLGLNDDVSGRMNYGTGRLEAEPGLYQDVSLISAAASKIAIALTPSLPASSPLISQFREKIQSGSTWIAIGTTPEFWFFDELLGEVGGQHAFQSVWMQVQAFENCTTCGREREGLSEAAVVGIDQLRTELRR
jgi:molybdopterin/thiamine biosynthesis adenylyltransferase/proteasome lid subunit RPN8/RPN11